MPEKSKTWGQQGHREEHELLPPGQWEGCGTLCRPLASLLLKSARAYVLMANLDFTAFERVSRCDCHSLICYTLLITQSTGEKKLNLLPMI